MSRFDRRRFLQLVLAVPAGFAAVTRARWGDPAEAAVVRSAATTAHPRRVLSPTPDCDDDDPTPDETAGPFFKPRSPLRTSLIESGVTGTRIVLTGRIVTSGCRPVPGALLDFWHADDAGDYDNDGFRCRGHQYANAQGRYRLETVVPGLYPGRTRHFHVKVQAPHGRLLTTQLYFPDEPRNTEDGLFRRDLLLTIRHAARSPLARDARFNFVVHTG